jgi:hypothetical protein
MANQYPTFNFNNGFPDFSSPGPLAQGSGGVTTGQSPSFFSGLAGQIGSDLIGVGVGAATGSPIIGAAAGWGAGQIYDWWSRPGSPGSNERPPGTTGPPSGQAFNNAQAHGSCSCKPSDAPKPSCMEQAQKQMQEKLERCQLAEKMKALGCVAPKKKASKKTSSSKKKSSKKKSTKKKTTKKKKTNKPKGIMATCFR